jgi:phage replication O-like protein O
MMANPNTENGYIKIANELWEAICRTRIPGEARQCFDAVLRQTYGYNKKSDKISMSQISELTGLARPSVARGIRTLLEMNIIKKNMDAYINILGINKDYDSWSLMSKMTIPKVVNSSATKTVNKIANKSVNEGANNKRHKDNKYIYAEFFERFWKKYPKRNGKKLGKQETLMTIMKQVKINELDMLDIALDNYINSTSVQNGYSKDPKRFIKNRDWSWRDWVESADQSSIISIGKKKTQAEINAYRPGEVIV